LLELSADNYLTADLFFWRGTPLDPSFPPQRSRRPISSKQDTQTAQLTAKKVPIFFGAKDDLGCRSHRTDDLTYVILVGGWYALGKWRPLYHLQRSSNDFDRICSELSADNPKKIALESPSFCTYNCSVSHLRRLGVHFKLSDGIALGESHLPCLRISSPSNTSLKRKGRYISTFPHVNSTLASGCVRLPPNLNVVCDRLLLQKWEQP